MAAEKGSAADAQFVSTAATNHTHIARIVPVGSAAAASAAAGSAEAGSAAEVSVADSAVVG